MKPLIAAVLPGLLLLQPAAADPAQPVMTAGELQQLCLASDTTSKNVCRVYILGVTQGMALGLEIADGKGPLKRPCVPATLSGESLAESVKARMARRPSVAWAISVPMASRFAGERFDRYCWCSASARSRNVAAVASFARTSLAWVTFC